MTIEERLTRLEKRAARWRALTICVGICLLLLVGMAASQGVGQSRILLMDKMGDQSRILLTDKDGKTRLLLCVEPSGDSRISFYNRQSVETMRIGAYDEGKPYISSWSTVLPRREMYVRFLDKKQETK